MINQNRFVNTEAAAKRPATRRSPRQLPCALLAISALTLSLSSFAREFQCASGDDRRFVRVDYPGVNHLCEVSVTKSDNSREVKWYADLDSTFCSSKVIELVGKYENEWGFSCEEWPDINKIDNLSARQRTLLDEILKKSMAAAVTDTPPYSILGTRALVTPTLAHMSVTQLKLANATSAASQRDANTKAVPPADEQATSLMAVQLFLTNTTDPTKELNSNTEQTDLLSPTNRVLLLEDDGETHRTITTLAELKDHIKVDREGYKLDSAIIESIHPGGEIQIATLVAAPGDNPEAAPSCYGQQRFRATDDGIESVDQHKFICDL